MLLVEVRSKDTWTVCGRTPEEVQRVVFEVVRRLDEVPEVRVYRKLDDEDYRFMPVERGIYWVVDDTGTWVVLRPTPDAERELDPRDLRNRLLRSLWNVMRDL